MNLDELLLRINTVLREGSYPRECDYEIHMDLTTLKIIKEYLNELNSIRERRFYEEFFFEEMRRGRTFNWGSTNFNEDRKEEPKNANPEEGRPWPEVLGVRSTATKSEIEKAYRSLAMKYHPDRKPHGDTKKFQTINAAYRRAGGK